MGVLPACFACAPPNPQHLPPISTSPKDPPSLGTHEHSWTPPSPCSRDASSEMRVVFVSWGVCLEAASGRYKEETDKERIRRAVNCLQSLGAGNI